MSGGKLHSIKTDKGIWTLDVESLFGVNSVNKGLGDRLTFASKVGTNYSAFLEIFPMHIGYYQANNRYQNWGLVLKKKTSSQVLGEVETGNTCIWELSTFTRYSLIPMSKS